MSCLAAEVAGGLLPLAAVARHFQRRPGAAWLRPDLTAGGLWFYSVEQHATCSSAFNPTATQAWVPENAWRCLVCGCSEGNWGGGCVTCICSMYVYTYIDTYIIYIHAHMYANINICEGCVCY